MLEFCTEQEFRVINVRKSIDLYNSEMKFEKLLGKYLVQNGNPQIKKTSETESNPHLDFDDKKTSPLGKTRCSEPDKSCSLNRSAKVKNPKSESWNRFFYFVFLFVFFLVTLFSVGFYYP